jgi:hypothetical protein
MKDRCVNCGGWKGLHHFETNQCPRNGVESPVGKKQTWQDSVYQEEDTRDETIAHLRSRLASLEAGREADGETIKQLRELLLKARGKLDYKHTQYEEIQGSNQCGCVFCEITEALAATAQKGGQHD